VEPDTRNPVRSTTAGADRGRGKLNADGPNQAGYREGGDRAQHQAHQSGADQQAGGMAAARDSDSGRRGRRGVTSPDVGVVGGHGVSQFVGCVYLRTLLGRAGDRYQTVNARCSQDAQIERHQPNAQDFSERDIGGVVAG